MIDAAKRVSGDFLNRILYPGALPVVYFTKTPNVGDLLNPYLLPKLCGKPIYRAQSGFLAHIRAIGSVVGSASHRSYIWGSGSIDGRVPVKGIDPSKVYALRGKKSWDMLNQAFGLHEQIPLGDPAVLIPDFYNPLIEGQYTCGIVPHFSDLPMVKEFALGISGLKIIDVRQKPEPFIDELKSCEFIVSSSLHGLILADSYDIPNLWVKFSDNLLGGDWKFQDYFSATDMSHVMPATVVSASALESVVRDISKLACVKRYSQSKGDLYKSFDQLCRDFK